MAPPRTRPRRTPSRTPVIAPVAAGITRIAHGSVNLYLIEHDGRLGLVDAGLPSSRLAVEAALAAHGAVPGDLAGVLVTHAHFDHLGCARWLQEEHGVEVRVHVGDAPLARRPYSYRPGSNRLGFVARHPGGWPHLGAMARDGALRVRGTLRTRALEPGVLRDFPGKPWVIPTPGHTDGSVALHFARSSAVLTGDALVTLDPYTGLEGPRVVATAGTADAEAAIASLGAIAATAAPIVLPGHGEPWLDGAAAAAREAARAGVA